MNFRQNRSCHQDTGLPRDVDLDLHPRLSRTDKLLFGCGSHVAVRRDQVWIFVTLFLSGLLAAGCDTSVAITYTEVKRIDEPLTTEEVEAFLEIVDHMPGQRLPNLPDLFLPPPNWNAERSLPVRDLVDGELMSLSERWRHEPILELLPRTRAFDRWLVRKRMTREQFVGLTMCIAAALTRSTVRSDQNLEAIYARGEAVKNDLRAMQHVFNSLSPESMHEVLHRATWLTRFDRANRLRSVPETNVDVVLAYADRLIPLFPKSITENPFDGIADRLEELGIPFEELPGTEPFDVLDWKEDDAIIGRDTIDEPQTPAVSGTLPPITSPAP